MKETIAQKKFGKTLKHNEPAEVLLSPDRQWVGCVFTDFSETNLLVLSADGETSWISEPFPYTSVMFYLPDSKRFGTVYENNNQKLSVSTWDQATGNRLETKTIEGDLTLYDSKLTEEEFNELGVKNLLQEPVLFDSTKQPENSFYVRKENLT